MKEPVSIVVRSTGAVGLVIVVGVVVGVLTSFGQTYLPDAVGSLANSAAPWSLVAFGLALLTRRAWVGIAFAVAGFVTLLAGYQLASELRFGYGMASGTLAFWLACTVVVGPVLGELATWARRDPSTGRSAAVAAVCGLLVGEGVYGLAVLANTSPVWWSISIALGLAGVLGFGIVGRARRQALLASIGTAIVAASFATVYTAAPAVL